MWGRSQGWGSPPHSPRTWDRASTPTPAPATCKARGCHTLGIPLATRCDSPVGMHHFPALLCTTLPRRWHVGAGIGPGKALVCPWRSQSLRMGPGRDRAHGAGGSERGVTAVFARGAPGKVPVPGCPELPVDPGDLWAPLQEQPLGMASSSPSQGVQIRPSPRAHPCSTPGVPPSPALLSTRCWDQRMKQLFPPQSPLRLSPAPVPEAGSGHAG